MINNKLPKLKVLCVDIETLHLGADTFNLGQQYINHKSLQPNRDEYDIICIQYKWDTDKKTTNLNWIGKETSSKGIMEKFDKQAMKADLILGKNSDKFDLRHLQTLRMKYKLPAIPQWSMPKTKDDLEKQIRRFFYLPSYSLDYLDKFLKRTDNSELGAGKDKMEFEDWQKIRDFKEAYFLYKQGVSVAHLNKVCNFYYYKSYREVVQDGKAALHKMYTYGDKDVDDTLYCWNRVLDYIKPQMNVGRFIGNRDGNYLRCKHCGSGDITSKGNEYRYAVLKKRFFCKPCNKEAGIATVLKNGKYGKIE